LKRLYPPGEEGLRHLYSQESELYQRAGYVKIRVIEEMHVQIDDDFFKFNLMRFGRDKCI
jgi:hypothetical protein